MRVSIRSTNVLTIQTHSWLPFAGGRSKSRTILNIAPEACPMDFFTEKFDLLKELNFVRVNAICA